jgi:hypothetical protein
MKLYSDERRLLNLRKRQIVKIANEQALSLELKLKHVEHAIELVR